MKFLFLTNSLAIALAGVLSASANAANTVLKKCDHYFFTATFDGLVWFKAVVDDGSFFGMYQI